MTPDEGQRRRSFHLIERIGTGAFGEVFLAELESAGGFRRKVALKLLHPHVSRRDIDRRFRDEARILGRLSHRNIVGVLDLVWLRDRWAVVMDYVPGADLDQVLQALHRTAGRIPPAAALELGAAVLGALHAAWTTPDGEGGQLQVVHRDIKPSNVRLSPDGEVKVLDFGVAKFALPAVREARTRNSGWIGTERYLAPERILCAGDGPEGDVYAATSTVVELLLGWPLDRTPVLPEPHAAFVTEAMAEVRGALDPAAAGIEPLIEALAGGLHADPAARPTAQELGELLEQAAAHHPGERLAAFARRVVPQVDAWLERPRDPANRTLSEPDPWPVGPTLVSIEPASPRRSRWLGVAGLAVVALGLGMGAGVAIAAFGGASAAAPRVEVGVAAAGPGATRSATPTTEPTTESTTEMRVEPEPAAAAPAPTAEPPAPRKAPRPSPRPPPSPAPTLSRAVVASAEASAIDVRCGDVTGTGSTSAVIRNFPAGKCEVTVHVGGRSRAAAVTIDRPRAVSCVWDGERLTCS